MSNSRNKVIRSFLFSEAQLHAEAILKENDPIYLPMFLRLEQTKLSKNYIVKAIDQIAAHKDPQILYQAFATLDLPHQKLVAENVLDYLFEFDNCYYIGKFGWLWYRCLQVLDDKAMNAKFLKNGLGKRFLDDWIDLQRSVNHMKLQRIVTSYGDSSQPIRSPETNIIKNREGEIPQFIVMHSAGAASAIERIAVNFLTPNPSISAHFVITENGRVFQFVDLKDAARTNKTDSDPTNDTYYKYATHEFFNKNPKNANDFTISIEFEEFGNHGSISESQKRSALETIALIKESYDIPIDGYHLIGHGEITPLTRSYCPGSNFPFEEIIMEYNNNAPNIRPIKPLDIRSLVEW